MTSLLLLLVASLLGTAAVGQTMTTTTTTSSERVPIIPTDISSITTTEEGLNFLADKQRQKFVVTRESGLQYMEIQAGTGKSPTLDSKTKCHYEGRLIDGTIFDSTYPRRRPAIFAPSQQLIKGWGEAMLLMKEGSIWEIYVPSELAYGSVGAGDGLIPPGAVVIFRLELVEVLDEKLDDSLTQFRRAKATN